MSFEILYENRELIVCIKPPLTPSQPDTTKDVDMTVLIRSHLEAKGDKSDVFVVHRLDRAVGGVMVYAKNKSACAYLSQAVSDKDRFTKEYLAIVSGTPEKESGTYEDYIYKDSKIHKAFIAEKERKGVKFASLDYSVLQTVTVDEKSFSLVKIKLNTGRYHQIRVQFASRKMPICGDGKYGSREKCDSLALWSHSLSFDYKGKQLSFSKEPDTAKPFWNLF